MPQAPPPLASSSFGGVEDEVDSDQEEEEITEELDFGEISGEAEKLAEMLATPAPKASGAAGAMAVSMRAYNNPLAAGADEDEAQALTGVSGRGNDPRGKSSAFPSTMKTYSNPLAGGSDGGSVTESTAPMVVGGVAVAVDEAVLSGKGAPGPSAGTGARRSSGGGGRGKLVQGSLDFQSDSQSSSDEDAGFGAQRYGSAAAVAEGRSAVVDDDGFSDSSAELEVFRPPPPRQQQSLPSATNPLFAGAATVGSGPGMYRLEVTTGTKVGSATDEDVHVKVVGSLGAAQEVLRNQRDGSGVRQFRSGQTDTFTVDAGRDLGAITSIQVGARDRLAPFTLHNTRQIWE